ncbi:uncharacterized protein K452DRAFT_326938 [Aplosporella prunicola CBS 121167]|uniref:Phenylalanine ammonia-lyase n=1 Tax=Aplosporella prunicola CBS 121167 TaxID=1176127 RepID=A0A6A6BD06_9PEZI|nr:uncharacterized protein K452DRAFT_326938 [Aplosporella prunicola CBS 121167]KAF2141175.1 hypothetical protein K452DRAFT_326938 [Aplosporella prunicola CBS 121167]
MTGTTGIKAKRAHADATRHTWSRLQNDAHPGESAIQLDGESLTLAQLVAVAKYGAVPTLSPDPAIVQRIETSVQMLAKHLNRGDLVYGVNTGYGGSADTRTDNLAFLQQALVQHQQSGILTRNDTGKPYLPESSPGSLQHSDDFGTLSMPSSWVKGIMLQRVNSLIRGHSAVSLPVIELIMTFLQHDITPVIPLRGSISASGDLSPMSYVAGALEGNSDIFVRVGNPPVIKTAKEALQSFGFRPVVLAAKEGLGLLNGTAASASAASLAIHETNQLAVLTQALTAMGVEALCGTAESFSPFIAKIRPHRGQVEVAANILGFLRGARLAHGLEGPKDMHVSGLCQDRYPLRTSSQWIGPQLEDLMLATEQVSTELNSTTDNPLMDVASDLIHHGGNFQAASITSAMEKTRTAIQMFGKLIFAQGTELINSMLNKGLPPNLAADDPSLSFTCKGIDINLAAYMSELGYLANPVSSHVQSAELHNQAVNSLALISARYTLQAVEVLNQMCAAYLFCLCQALDLRVLQAEFLAQAYKEVRQATVNQLGVQTPESMEYDNDGEANASGAPPAVASVEANLHEEYAPRRAGRVFDDVWAVLKNTWNASGSMDLDARAEKTAQAAAQAFYWSLQGRVEYADVCAYAATVRGILASGYAGTRARLFAEHRAVTPLYLGQASRKLYLAVRGELGVPFHRGLVEYPGQPVWEDMPTKPSLPADQRRTIGGQVSVIYEGLRDGVLHRAVMEALGENEGAGVAKEGAGL